MTSYSLVLTYDHFADMTSNTSAVRTITHVNNRIDWMTAPGGVTAQFAYDARGNVIQDVDHAYNYDLRNRLLSLAFHPFAAGSAPTPQGTFTYDASGRRVIKTVNDTTTYYVRDQQGQVLSEFRKSASNPAAPAWDKDYIYAAGRLVAEAENDNPHTPTAFTSYGSTEPTGRIHLSWDPPPDTDLGSYKVYHKCDNTVPHDTCTSANKNWTSVSVSASSTIF